MFCYTVINNPFTSAICFTATYLESRKSVSLKLIASFVYTELAVLSRYQKDVLHSYVVGRVNNCSALFDLHLKLYLVYLGLRQVTGVDRDTELTDLGIFLQSGLVSPGLTSLMAILQVGIGFRSRLRNM